MFREERNVSQPIVYDGKRMRKAVQRRTIDYNASMIQYHEHKGRRRYLWEFEALKPHAIYSIKLLPPSAYAITIPTKFVHASANKVRSPVHVAKWSPDGRRIVTGSASGEFTLWNGLFFNFETILQGHESPIRAMSWSHSGDWIISGSAEGTIKYYQPSMNNPKTLNNAHRESIRSLSFAPSDAKFASASDDGLIKIWDFGLAVQERELAGSGSDIRVVDWNPQISLIGSGSKDSLLRFWDPRGRIKTPIASFHGHKAGISALSWCPSSSSSSHLLLSGSRDGTCKLWDFRNQHELSTFRLSSSSNSTTATASDSKREISSVSWHPMHQNLFVCGSSDGNLYFWNHLYSEAPVGVCESAHESTVTALDWHPVGHILVSASTDSNTRFWTRYKPGESSETFSANAEDSTSKSESAAHLDEHENRMQIPEESKRSKPTPSAAASAPGLVRRQPPPPPPKDRPHSSSSTSAQHQRPTTNRQQAPPPPPPKR